MTRPRSPATPQRWIGGQWYREAFSAEDLPQGGAKRLNIVAPKRSELLQDQSLFDCRDDGLDQRCLWKSRALPVADQYLTKSSSRPENLTRDSHDDHVRPPLMIRVRADNDGRSLFRGGLIGERKWDEDDVAEAIGGRIRHRRSCPKRRRTHPQKDAWRPARNAGLDLGPSGSRRSLQPPPRVREEGFESFGSMFLRPLRCLSTIVA